MEKKFFPSLNKEEIESRVKLEQAYCHKPQGCYLAKLSLDSEIAFLLPYIKPQVKALYFEPAEGYLIFKWPFRGIFYKVSLTNNEVKIGIVRDKEEAAEVLIHLFNFLSDLYSKRDNLKPDFNPIKRPSTLEIYKILPKTNCRDCGELSCLAFAGKVSMAEAELSDCPHLSKENLRAFPL
jgi:ArsR family metal-binding transcriptional regulator